MLSETYAFVVFAGHELGRPLFGSRFCGEREDLLISWGVDGRLCLWDSYLLGNVNAPIAVLKHDSEYPIYAVELSKNCVAVGGGSEGGFIGVPLHLYSFLSSKSEGEEQIRIEELVEECTSRIDSTKNDDSGSTKDNPNPPDQKDGNSKLSEAKTENNPPPDKKLKTEEVSNDTKSANDRSGC
jgi:hypothetical protein